MSTPVTPLSGRSPPEQLAQFTWIVDAAIKGTNEVRGNIYQVNIGSFFRSPVLPLARSSRLLAITLAHDLLGWNSGMIGTALSAGVSANSGASPLLNQSRRWCSAGCLDEVSGRSLAPVREAILAAFSVMTLPEAQNLTVNKPPEPPPRQTTVRLPRTAREFLRSQCDSTVTASQPSKRSPRRSPARTRRTAEEGLHSKPRDALSAAPILAAVADHFGVAQQAILSNARHRALVTPRHIAMYLTKTITGAGYPTIARQFHRKDHTTAIHAVRKIAQNAANDNQLKSLLEELASQARALSRRTAGKEEVLLPPILSAPPAAGRALRPIPSSALTLDDPLVKAPFLRHLHERLIKAALAMEFCVKDFVAEMIARGLEQRTALRPLAPPSFLQALGHNGLDVPERLAAHAMFIQQTLYDLASLLPTRNSLQARAAVVRPINPAGFHAGD